MLIEEINVHPLIKDIQDFSNAHPGLADILLFVLPIFALVFFVFLVFIQVPSWLCAWASEEEMREQGKKKTQKRSE